MFQAADTEGKPASQSNKNAPSRDVEGCNKDGTEADSHARTVTTQVLPGYGIFYQYDSPRPNWTIDDDVLDDYIGTLWRVSCTRPKPNRL